MPDDSAPQQRDAQQAHGREIAFERQLMRTYGLSRSQVRERLRTAQAVLINRVLTKPQVVAPPLSGQMPQVITESKHKAPDISGGTVSGTGSTGGLGPKFEGIVLSNGVLKYADVRGNLKDDV